MIYSPHRSACNSLQARRVGEDACEFEMGDGHEGLGDGDLADLLADGLAALRVGSADLEPEVHNSLSKLALAKAPRPSKC